jgi:hypothetical protein
LIAGKGKLSTPQRPDSVQWARELRPCRATSRATQCDTEARNGAPVASPPPPPQHIVAWCLTKQRDDCITGSATGTGFVGRCRSLVSNLTTQSQKVSDRDENVLTLDTCQRSTVWTCADHVRTPAHCPNGKD